MAENWASEKNYWLELWKDMMCKAGKVNENGDCITPDGILKACVECRYSI